MVQAVNQSDVGLVAAEGAEGQGGIVGIMWQQSNGTDPATGMLTPRPWTGVGGCTGECRVKDAAFIDCTRVLLDGVLLVDSSDWTLLLRRSSDVLVKDVVMR